MRTHPDPHHPVQEALKAAARALQLAADALDGGPPPSGDGAAPSEEDDERAGADGPPPLSAEDKHAARLIADFLTRTDTARDERRAGTPCGSFRGDDPCLKPLGIRCPRCEVIPENSLDAWLLRLHGPLDLNAASPAEIRRGLPFMGPKRLARIIGARPFASVEDLARAGFGRTLIERWRPLVTLSAAAADAR